MFCRNGGAAVTPRLPLIKPRRRLCRIRLALETRSTWIHGSPLTLPWHRGCHAWHKAREPTVLRIWGQLKNELLPKSHNNLSQPQRCPAVNITYKNYSRYLCTTLQFMVIANLNQRRIWQPMKNSLSRKLQQHLRCFWSFNSVLILSLLNAFIFLLFSWILFCLLAL